MVNTCKYQGPFGRARWHSSTSQAMQSKQLVSFSMRFEQVSFISSCVLQRPGGSNWDLVEMANIMDYEWIIMIDDQMITNVVKPCKTQ